MFNNLINIHDFSRLIEKIKQGQFSRIAAKLFSGRRGKIEKSWEHVENPPTNWWDIEAVREHWNYLISGSVKVDYCEYISRKYLSDRDALNALSLACGTGRRELRWAELGKFGNIDAYDLSEARIKYARNQAHEKGGSV